MIEKDIKQKIIECLETFSEPNLTENSLKLFQTLGYDTKRQAPLDESSYDCFNATFIIGDTKFRQEKALVSDWKQVNLLFQLSSEEITPQINLFTTERVDDTIMESYIFFCIELSKGTYTRSELSQITREVNRLFPMPVMILFKHGSTVTVSVINRRLNQKDEKKDVLMKVTLIKDINFKNPHRAHIEILYDMTFDELKTNNSVSNFVDLHKAWQKTLNIKELNKRFYKEISAWYFWAMKEVYYPGAPDNAFFVDPRKDPIVREHNAKNLIRLLTRILFVWFIKEKGLIPDELFDENKIDKIIKGFNPHNDDRHRDNVDLSTLKSCYYKSILQNLFFATLNQSLGKREFRKSGQHMNVTNLMRYENYFNDPKQFIDIVEKAVPFMNGGLFECLDKPDPTAKGKQGGDKIIYEDGFSDRNDNLLYIPDYIFFAETISTDLSEEFGVKAKNTEVKGLINILKSYKFTIAENTPIEEDIALDPELLGKAFENLLASYNPETKSTARKQTGSFYTPREVVDFMVDISLKAYLKKSLINHTKMNSDDAEEGLNILFTYTEKDHAFNDEERKTLISAIDGSKILDPACGSGAFPMGILHKMVYILHKLDPQNELWKEKQIEKVDELDDPNSRDIAIRNIEEAFENNELDYGRKLYLIENCIFGIDIQPIAIQISKLRFFISLIVDQRVNLSKENFGVIPLPNLESKFVIANTLINVEKPDAQRNMFGDSEIIVIENELRRVRHNLFKAKTPSTKRKLREDDQIAREKLGSILIANGWKKKTAFQIANWDPYDQNASSSFFDSEWMFGIIDGFDIVIGNPPYIQLQKNNGMLATQLEDQKYSVFERTGDIYCLFYEKGINLLGTGGILCYITSNKWLRAGYGKKLRGFMAKINPRVLIDLGPNVFETATVDTNILVIENSPNADEFYAASLQDKVDNLNENFTIEKSKVCGISENAWFIGNDAVQKLKEKIERIGTPLKDWDVTINYGIKTGLNEAFVINQEKYNEIVLKDSNSVEILKPILRGRDIKRYGYEWAGLYLIQSGYDIDVPNKYPAVYEHLHNFEDKAQTRCDQGKNWWNLRACVYYDDFEKEKLIWQEMSSEPCFSYDNDNIYCNDTGRIMIAKNIKFFTGFFNTRFFRYIFSNFYAGGELGATGIRFKHTFMLNVPISSGNIEQENMITSIVNDIVNIKKMDSLTETSALETEIDQIIYEIYGLTEEEIMIIEG